MLEARLAPAGSIADVQPAGGAVQGGGHTAITWTSTGTSGFVDVLLSTDAGATFDTTLVSDLPDSGQFGWNVPADLSTSQAEIRVVDHADAGVAATSASPFRISQPTVPIISTVAGNGFQDYTGDNGPATSATLNQPYGLAVDGQGDLFIADAMNNVIREVDHATGKVRTVAGIPGQAGNSGDGGPATSALLNGPYWVAADSQGNLFIADGGNQVIREVSQATGIITTVAGNGTVGYSGDNGPATSAKLNSPGSLVLDSQGDLFFVDFFNDVVRRVDHATGIITTVAGNGTVGYSGDGGPATSAELNALAGMGIALDSQGNLFLADAWNYRVREVDHATGIITTVAGSGSGGYWGDNGPATSALMAPQGVAVDTQDNLFIADGGNSRIRKVDHATGIITTVVGNGTQGYTGDNGPAHSAELNQPQSVVLDSQGNLFISDFTNVVRRVDAATGIITAWAGTLLSGEGSPATAASLNNPQGVALDSQGNLFIADRGNQVVRRVDAATGLITTVAGSGSFGFSGDGGSATSAQLAQPSSVALDAQGDLFIADTNNNVVRKVDQATGIITTVAGTWNAIGSSGDGGPATSALFAFPVAVAADRQGDFFIADLNNNTIRKVDQATGIITTVAGTPGKSGFSGDGGPATSALLNLPHGVAVNGLGDLFIADSGNNVIRKVDHATGIITTVAGTPSQGSYGGDGGPATSALLSGPRGIALNSQGDLFFADFNNGVIRKVDHATGVLTTVAGAYAVGSLTGDNGPATSAGLNAPTDVAVDPLGNLFIADSEDHVIRRVTPPALIIPPSINDVQPSGGTVQGGGTTAITWTSTGVSRVDVLLSTDGGTSFATTLVSNLPDSGRFSWSVPADLSTSQAEVRVVDHADAGVAATSASPFSISKPLDPIISIIAGNGFEDYGGDNGPATGATLNNPFGLAVDGLGNLFIADTNNDVIREVDHPTNKIRTVAGIVGQAGNSGDGGPATSALLNSPTWVTTDSQGDLFIADGGNNRIREVNQATGIITTVAGNGTAGYSGDGGAATSAQLNHPRSLAVDSQGNLFFVDFSNDVVRRVDHATGIITTVAGNGTVGYSGDGGPATSAELSNFGDLGVTVDSQGNLFIVDGGNSCVREVDRTTGNITTVAGNGIGGYSGDGGPATNSVLDYPASVAVDSQGNLFIADRFNNRIREVNQASGIITTVAGNGTQGSSGDNGPATSAELNSPLSVALDSHGDLFISDFTNVIRRVDAASGIITTVAGTLVSGENGAATSASLNYPQGVVEDSQGNLFIADTGNHVVRRVDHATGLITTVAGTGSYGFSGDGGPATSAQLTNPYALALDTRGHLFIADLNNNVVRGVDLATGIITTVAGTPGSIGSSGDGGPATSALLDIPIALATDSQGNLFIADWQNHTIRKVDQATGIITTVAGTPGQSGDSGDGGPATSALLNLPHGLAVNSLGDLFIADTGNSIIRKVDHATGIISAVAGDPGGVGYIGDGGPATTAFLKGPEGIALSSDGDLYFADAGNNVIRRVDHVTGLISTVAGTFGLQGLAGDNGPATSAGLNGPSDVIVDPQGNLLIADSQDHVIRRVTQPSLLLDTVRYDASSQVLQFIGQASSANVVTVSSPLPGIVRITLDHGAGFDSPSLSNGALASSFVLSSTRVRNDTLTIHTNAGQAPLSQFDITLGSGDDSLSFSLLFSRGVGNVTIDTGSGNDRTVLGPISLNGHLSVTSSSIISTASLGAGGDIALVGDEIDLGNPATIHGMGTLTFMPRDPDRPVLVGGAQDVAGSLTLTDGDLLALDSNFLQLRIGRRDGSSSLQTAGNVDLFRDTTLMAGTGGVLVSNLVDASGDMLTLSTSGPIVTSGNGLLRASQASLRAASIGSASQPLNTDIGTLAALAEQGGIVLANRSALTIGTVGPLKGVTATGGPIALGAAALTIGATVRDTGLDPVRLKASTAKLTLAPGVVIRSGGNVTLQASGNLTLRSRSVVQSDHGIVSLAIGQTPGKAVGTLEGRVSGRAVTASGGSALVVDYTAGASLPQGLGYQAGSSGSVLIVQDHGGTSGHKYSASGNQVVRDRGKALHYRGVVAVTLSGGKGHSTFAIHPSALTSFTVDAGPAGDFLEVDLHGAVDPRLKQTAQGGKYTFANFKTIRFTGRVHLR